ncbi:MAG: AAA family ATPase [Candidatus Thiodiazotropha sp. (ex Codakia rugifera)]|nr:AAA family ATPase [Candidatus Thiodiazotropha sp. (ex Codakia rugifera)]
MIINAIQSSNILKYADLDLQDIPEQGLIAVSGPNESGKSSIGETVCFALFGRTFSLNMDELSKVIRWGETHCSAKLEFTPRDGKRYRLERFLDDAGNHSARLTLAASASNDEPIARGVEQVADKVYELIGYEYEEFVESFYLAQREITTPHPHSYAVKTMAGLVTLEYCDAACKEDKEETLNEVEQRQTEQVTVQGQIEEVGIDPQLMPSLESEHAEISRHMDESNRLIEQLDDASIAYQDALPKREKALSARGRAGFFRFIFLLLTLLAGGAWYVLAKMPEHEYALQLSEFIGNMAPNWQASWLLYAAAAFALLFVIFWIRRVSNHSSTKAYDETASVLATALDNLSSLPAVEIQDDSEVSEAASEVASTESLSSEEQVGSESESIVVDRAARERLSQRVSDWSAGIAEVRDGVGHEESQLRKGVEVDRRRLGQLDQVIAQEQERLDRVEQLQGIKADLKQKIEEKERHMAICAVADELIQGTTREVSHQFNRKLRGLVSKTLPLFTENRYEHLQIDDDLSVRAFSSEKRDFMDLDEISSGTQRQIMLAVRLALSQELVDRAVQGSQFLFLDEPFAFFDEKRTRSSLTVLPTLSEELNQIWIVAQDFADDLKFDLHVHCDRESDSIPLKQA